MHKIELRRKAQRAFDRLPKDDFNAVLGTVKGLANIPRPKGVEKIRSAGAALTTVETVFFELLKEAGGDRFKKIAALIK